MCYTLLLFLKLSSDPDTFHVSFRLILTILEKMTEILTDFVELI